MHLYLQKKGLCFLDHREALPTPVLGGVITSVVELCVFAEACSTWDTCKINICHPWAVFTRLCAGLKGTKAPVLREPEV